MIESILRLLPSNVRGLFGFFLVGLSISMASVLSAQQDKENIYELSPFHIQGGEDNGYRATNTISGTRLNTAIKDLPMPIEVMTEEFIDDIEAVDLKEILAFSSGITTDEFLQPTGPGNFDFSPSRVTNREDNSTVVNIRGFTTGTQLRLGFRSGIQYDITVIGSNTDPVNLERAEVVRGPAALLYGVSFLGGVVNYIPKRPSNTPQYSVKAGYGTDDFQRVELDATGPLFTPKNGNSINYRLMYSQQDRDDGIVDQRRSKATYLAAQVDWQMNTNTYLFAELQYSTFDRDNQGGNFRDIVDGDTGRGDPFGLNEYDEPFVFGRDLYGKDQRTFNWSAVGKPYEDQEVITALFQIDQRFSDNLHFQGGIQYSEAEIERSYYTRGQFQTRRNLAPDPSYNYDYTLSNGSTGSKSYRFDWATDPFEAKSLQLRGDLSYNFDWGDSNHNFLLGVQYWKDEFERYARHNNRGSFANLNDPEAPFLHTVLPSWRTFTFDERWARGLFAVYQGKLFSNERLHVVAGYRQDRFAVRLQDYNNVASDPVNNVEWEFNESTANQGPGSGGDPTRAPVKDGYRFGGEAPTEGNVTAGITYKINDSVNIYGLRANGLFFNPGQRDGRSDNFDNERTTSTEFGLKVDLLENKISGTLSYFEVERENAVFFYSFAPSPRLNITNVGGSGNAFDPRLDRTYEVDKTLFPEGYVPFVDDGEGNNVNSATGGGTHYVVNYETLAANPTEKAAMDAAFAAGGNELLYNGNNPSESRGSDVPFAETAKGIDAQFIFSLTSNWQVTFNYARIEKEVTEAFRLVDHIDLEFPELGNLATEYDIWVRQLGADAFEDPKEPSTLRPDGSSIVGTSLSLEPEQSFSFFSSYRLEDGVFKGTRLSLGAIYSGDRPTALSFGGGSADINTFRTPDLDPRWEWRLGVGYLTKIGDANWRFNLTVNNLFDDIENETRASYVDGGSTELRRSFAYYNPRSIRFTAQVSF
ncbi:MAG: TonB-dependent receptor plug domain-containing protein [Verrucomicrobiae bacterium]|nr:TonB-dependent receptor plug domain-containing protein [Verrucomicrobiae bacterium]